MAKKKCFEIEVKMNKKRILFLICWLIPFLLIDQLTKCYARNIISKSTINIIDGILEFRFLKNTGAAWGSFSSMTSMLSIITIIMIIAVVFIYMRIPFDKRMLPLRMLLVFIITGAVGNLIDRIAFKYVTDFIYFRLINFPIFNVADIYVTCSALIMAILILFYYKDEDFEWLKFR